MASVVQLLISELQYSKNASVCLSFNKVVPVENSAENISHSTTSGLSIIQMICCLQEVFVILKNEI